MLLGQFRHPSDDHVILLCRCVIFELRINIFFGETALISNDTRSATVTANEECKVLVLTSRKFHELCQKQSLLGYRVMLKLAQRMINTISQTNKDKALLYQALFNEIAGN